MCNHENETDSIKLPIKEIDSVTDIANLIPPEKAGTYFAETANGELVVVERNTHNYIVKVYKKRGKREFFDCTEYDNHGNAVCFYFEDEFDDCKDACYKKCIKKKKGDKRFAE